MKVIKLEIYQEQAHFREPKILNSNLITTLPLPPPTTVVGMLTHLYGERFNEVIDIGMVGKFEGVRTDFQRCEKSEWIKKFERDLKLRLKRNSDRGKNGYPDYFFESFPDYKKRKQMASISTFEVLQSGSITIFIKTQSDDTLNRLSKALKAPSYYSSLGRKEDYARIINAETVEIEENAFISQKEAIKSGFILKNTYVPVNLKSTGAFFESAADLGVLYVIPRIYKNLDAQKQDREYIHQHYIHIGENSRYLAGNFNRYEKIIFKWLVQTGD